MTDKTSDTPTETQESLRDKILAERDKGNLVYAHIEGYSVVAVDDFVKQPVDGMLYDLNRGEEVILSFITEKKWINDFAVALTIRKLVEQRDNAERRLAAAEKDARNKALEEAANVCDARSPYWSRDLESNEINETACELACAIRALKSGGQLLTPK